MQNIQAYIDLLKAEVVPALGCTEPIAVALAVAKAREVLGEEPQQVELLLSPNIFKNGMGVGVPLTGITGLPIAAALGAFYGKSSDCLEVLKDVDNETVGNAKAFVKKGKVSIGVKKDSEKLYIEAICYGINGNTSKAIITTKHSNISQIEFNNEVIECSSEIKVGENENIGSVSKVISPLSVNSIFSFATTVPYSQIKFIHKTVEYNYAIAQEGLSKDYGLMVGKKLKEIIDKGILSDDIMNSAMSLTAAASDARMSGSVLPVMSNSGSGNQGLTATLPIYSVALQLKSDDEQIARALVLSHLIAIHIKQYLGRLSALCGCVVAATGAGCGISYLMGGGEKETIYTIKNMIGNITGMICDGAKEGCSLKVSTGVGAAIQSALLAIEGVVISSNDGIIEDDVEKTIRNLGEVGAKGMTQTDDLLLQIMVSKK
ncbi:MAG: L-serine ammonia-lyase, iron-sulfur-dependent, subunit alpha [Bacteroidales bacterium]|nr:L-serine ammonia-lyase, iron-sulfur-dependent, subunit alpha [Bacteroidales bacterium]MDD4217132.1 L-serine ammonia-lyase, iron-sulfur-dependent, subunit alpha [Bacteroidales bacterium]MDY0142386.1 L-serine ammonia-lyase, iron-sulfur-dependent, subunit alpha [Bacteroidales bacterium]